MADLPIVLVLSGITVAGAAVAVRYRRDMRVPPGRVSRGQGAGWP
ncbi:hypothetical protein [Methanoculleus formosensis]|nr:hypothetical protein [Methanoculleus sp. Afa-1]